MSTKPLNKHSDWYPGFDRDPETGACSDSVVEESAVAYEGVLTSMITMDAPVIESIILMWKSLEIALPFVDWYRKMVSTLGWDMTRAFVFGPLAHEFRMPTRKFSDIVQRKLDKVLGYDKNSLLFALLATQAVLAISEMEEEVVVARPDLMREMPSASRSELRVLWRLNRALVLGSRPYLPLLGQKRVWDGDLGGETPLAMLYRYFAWYSMQPYRHHAALNPHKLLFYSPGFCSGSEKFSGETSPVAGVRYAKKLTDAARKLTNCRRICQKLYELMEGSV